MTQPQEKINLVNPFNGENVGAAVDYYTFRHAETQIRELSRLKYFVGTAAGVYAKDGRTDLIRSANEAAKYLDASIQAHMWTCRMYEP